MSSPQNNNGSSEHSHRKVPGQSPTGGRLPKDIQETLDSDEKLWDALYEGRAPDSTETSSRYAAYAARARTILRAAHRYVAYTSDIGESFRPIAHPYLVSGAYAVSWMYLVGDVANEGRKAYMTNKRLVERAGVAGSAATDTNNEGSEGGTLQEGIVSAARDIARPRLPGIAPIDDYRTVMVQRAIFQSVASMGLPAVTIHSIVKYSGRALKNSANKTIRTWGPIGLGLGTVPFLPFIFDEPVEHAVDWTFHKGFEALGAGPSKEEKDLQKKKEL